jgi:cell division septal protein FtsQ
MNPTERQPVAVAGSDDNERLRTLLENLVNTSDQDFRDVSLQPKPVEDLDNLMPRVSRDDETSDRVRATESRTKRRSSRGFARFLVAVCIGVAGTLAWQSYGEATKQIIAAVCP